MAMRFGLLGTGHWAEHIHGPALAAHPEVELVGVWGRDPAKAEALGARWGVPGCADVADLLGAVDAVAIALPPDIQAELAVRAATAGCHLLLEKPLALSTDAADRVVAAVDAAGVTSVIFFTRRYDPAVRAFLEQSADRDWHGAQVTMFGSIFQPGSPYGGSQWRRDHGGLWDVGPHALSILLPVLGPVVEVVAFAGLRSTSHVLLRHDTGAVSSLALTLDAPAAALAYEFTLYGEHGRVPVPDAAVDSAGAAHVAVTDLLTTAEAGHEPHPCDVRFGRDVVAVLARAEDALATSGR